MRMVVVTLTVIVMLMVDGVVDDDGDGSCV